VLKRHALHGGTRDALACADIGAALRAVRHDSVDTMAWSLLRAGLCRQLFARATAPFEAGARKEPRMGVFTALEAEYLRSQRLARLATASASVQPDVSAVGFGLDGDTIVSGGLDVTKTVRYRHLVEHPRATIVIDDLASTPGAPRREGPRASVDRKARGEQAHPDRARGGVELGHQPGRREAVRVDRATDVHQELSEPGVGNGLRSTGPDPGPLGQERELGFIIITSGCLIAAVAVVAVCFLIAAVVLLVRAAWPVLVVLVAAMLLLLARRAYARR